MKFATVGITQPVSPRARKKNPTGRDQEPQTSQNYYYSPKTCLCSMLPIQGIGNETIIDLISQARNFNISPPFPQPSSLTPVYNHPPVVSLEFIYFSPSPLLPSESISCLNFFFFKKSFLMKIQMFFLLQSFFIQQPVWHVSYTNLIISLSPACSPSMSRILMIRHRF